MWFDNTEKEASLLRDYGTPTFPAVLLVSIVELVGIDPFGAKELSYQDRCYINHNRESSGIFFDASENILHYTVEI